MADQDILYDSSRQNDVMNIMLGLGYSAESIGKSHHDVYHKPPIFNFEMHTALFGPDMIRRGWSITGISKIG